MEEPEKDTRQPNKKRISNLAITAIAGGAGCFTLVVVMGAVFLGLWLDQRFTTRPLLTIILVILSIPVSVVGMYGIVRGVISRIQP